MVNLQKGQSVRLEKSGRGALSRVTMGIGWDVRKAAGLSRFFGGKGGDIDLDASCLLFDDNGRMVDAVWFRQLRSTDGSILHMGDNRTGAGEGDDEQVIVNLVDVPSAVKILVFTVSSFQGDTFDRIDNAYCRLVDAVTDIELARYDLTGSGSHTGQIMAKLSRADGGWEMKAIGDPTNGRTFHDMLPAIATSI